MKRYAIVRVCTDNGIYRCPTNNGKCLYPKGVEVYCKKCAEINGDTKEQFVKKIMTAFKIAIKKHKEGKFVKEKSSNRQVAEIVAEFLGVEE